MSQAAPVPLVKNKKEAAKNQNTFDFYSPFFTLLFLS